MEQIWKLVAETPLVDTHEHLLEESTRLGPSQEAVIPAMCQRDFSIFFSHYADHDLVSAGFPSALLARLFEPTVEPADKWSLIAPFYDRIRHTGYAQSARLSLQMLCEENDFRAENIVRISDRVAARIQPGYYADILHNHAKIEHAQVNSLETPLLCDTAQPELLLQDLSFVAMSTGLQVDALSKAMNLDVASLADWHTLIEACFSRFGPRAIAVKNQSAYTRRLNYDRVPASAVSDVFARYLEDPTGLSAAETKALQDHLFHMCVEQAKLHRLPVKLHTGYYASVGQMPLERLRQNPSDLCAVLEEHPTHPFVIMHMAYPYQGDVIALAKQYPNAYVDLCWAWILNPVACVRFVKEFLVTAPAHKLLIFGGDYGPVELVPGHAEIARRGLVQTLTELLNEGWLNEQDLPMLVERLMRQNAHELFDVEGTIAAWTTD